MGNYLATAGDVVFYGTLEGYIKAVDDKTGKELWRFKTPSGIIGNVMTYQHKGKQFVGILSGVGGWAGIGLAAGLAPGVVTGLWAGALSGVYTLPANGTQIAAANFDLTGTTKLGTKLLDHSFFVPMLIMTVVSVASGAAIGAILY